MENAIKSLQSAFAILAVRCGYDTKTNTFMTPDPELCEAIHSLRDACEAIYQAEGIDAIDLQARPELQLHWKFDHA